jgi:phosphoglycolate phosphatase
LCAKWKINVVTLCCQGQTFSPIQAIVFDKDGTLAQVNAYLMQLAQKRARLVDAQVPGVQEPLLMAFGIERDRINPMGLQAVGSRQENLIAAAAYTAETGRPWSEALQTATQAFQEADTYLPDKASQTPLFTGLHPWLTTLSQQGIKLGILSADTSTNIEQFVAAQGLERIIQNSLGSSEQLGKPDPRFYQALCQQLDVNPAHTLMLGDSTLDMVMARHAGAGGCIGVTWGWQTPVAIDQADALIHSPEQLALL